MKSDKSADGRPLKSSYVFNAGPLRLFFADDERVAELFREVSKGIVAGYTCERNPVGLRCKTSENLGGDAALVRYTSRRRSPLVIAAPDEALTRTAGELKGAHPGQPLPRRIRHPAGLSPRTLLRRSRSPVHL